MTEQNSSTPVVQAQSKPLTAKAFFNQENVQSKFKEILGERSVGFITSVMQVVSSDKNLANVDAKSIYQAAAMAAVLNLPINNNLGYSWLVPFKGKATFIVGWKGFVQMALRTREYKHINVLEVYANQFKSYNPITEVLDADFTVDGEGAIAGYCAYFKLTNGFEKTVYWSTKRVTEHAKKYSKAFSHPTAPTPWKDPLQFPEMAKKTVLKNMLSKWGILSIELEKATIADQGVVRDVETMDIDYIDNPEHQETVDTATGEMKLSNESKSAASTENKIADKTPAKKVEEPQATDTPYTGLKVRTIHNTYAHDQSEIQVGFIGVCTEDNGVTVTLNNGEIVCPRSSVRLAAHDEALSSIEPVEEPKEEVADETPAGHSPTTPGAPIKMDYTVEELTALGTDLKIRSVASQYLDFEKLGLSKVTNKVLRNIILHGQEGKLKWFCSQYYAGKESLIRSWYVETFVPPVAEVKQEAPMASPEPVMHPAGLAPEPTFEIAVVPDGGERDFDQMRVVFDYIEYKTAGGLTDDNLQVVVDALGEGYFDFYNTIENITKFASVEEMDKIINKFLNK